MTKLLSTLSFSLLGLSTVSAIAQTRYCIGGDLDHLSTDDRAACTATMQAVRSTATALHAPDDWHFVVVCGEEGWKQYAVFSEHDPAQVAEAAADTVRDQHVTYLRADSLHAPQPHSLQHVVAHEVASILLKSDDENAIQDQMALWERNSHPQMADASR